MDRAMYPPLVEQHLQAVVVVVARRKTAWVAQERLDRVMRAETVMARRPTIPVPGVGALVESVKHLPQQILGKQAQVA